jgi:hypothetical protein
MGALLVYFAIGSIVSVPVLGYHLLRTRRELSELRSELRRRGLIGPGADGAPSGAGAQAVPGTRVERPPTPAALAEASPAAPAGDAVRAARSTTHAPAASDADANAPVRPRA